MRPSLRKGAYAALSGAPWQEIRVRFGRDDSSVCGVEGFDEEFGKSEGHTAGPSTALRFGRDDSSVCGVEVLTENSGSPRGTQQVPPLRFASVGMTALFVGLRF